MTSITTAEELDALPTGTILADSGKHPVWRNSIFGWCTKNGARGVDSDLIISDGAPLTVLYRPDQPLSAAPTVEQITEVVLRAYQSRSAPAGGHAFSAYVAKAIAALYPTCQPSVESIEELIWAQVRCICDGCWLDSRKAAENIRGLYDNQPVSAEVLAAMPEVPPFPTIRKEDPNG